jgi:hypothetical protein
MLFEAHKKNSMSYIINAAKIFVLGAQDNFPALG